MSAHAIQTRNLTKTFPGGVVAVSGLDLRIERGSVFGLMGRNGAGKTTTLRLLMGLLQPDQGSARVLDSDLAAAPRGVRARVAYVSQSMQLPGWMTLPELGRYAASFYKSWDADLARDLARRWALPGDRPVGRLSGGEQRRVVILLALAPRPDVLLLDEPAAGLDPVARRELIDELISLLARQEGCTVLLSTHLVGDLERIAEHVGVLDRGRLLLSGRLDELQSGTRRVQIIFPGDAPPPSFALPGAARLQASGPVVTGITRRTDGQFLEALRRRPGVRVHLFPLGLEEIFIEMVNRGAGPESAEAGSIPPLDPTLCQASRSHENGAAARPHN